MKSLIIYINTFLIALCLLWWSSIHAAPPTFEKNFSEHLLQSSVGGQYGNESLWDRSTLWLDKNKSITENIRNMFYPDVSGQWGKIRDLIKVIGLLVFVWALVRQGFRYVLAADEESKAKSFHMNFLYILLGWVIFFAATWILWIGLGVWWDGWTSGLLERLDNSIAFQIFSAIRAGAFFTALVLLWYYWRSMMSAMDDEEKFKTMRQWVINILIVLVSIKVIDYVYFVAQSPEFKSKATELIVEVSKVLLYILWWFLTISIMYYWFRLMFSGGNEEALTKVKNVITTALLGTLVIFIFFLIIYQVVQEFNI